MRRSKTNTEFTEDRGQGKLNSVHRILVSTIYRHRKIKK